MTVQDILMIADNEIDISICFDNGNLCEVALIKSDTDIQEYKRIIGIYGDKRVIRLTSIIANELTIIYMA